MNMKFLISRGSLLLSKYAPEILTGVGIVGTFTSGAMMYKAIQDAREAFKETISAIDTLKNTSIEDVDQSMIKGLIASEYAALIRKLIGIFGPAIVLGALSASCLVKSNRILNKRNASLAAAYEIINDAFKRYRQAVVEKYGEDEDRNFRRGVKSQKVSEKQTEGEEGKAIQQVSVDGPVDYGREFGPDNPLYMRDLTMTMWQLRKIQSFCNQVLAINGHLFLNEVYDELGYPRTDYGQIVGWLYNSEKGDGVIDFGIVDPTERSREEIERGELPVFWLDFNVEGPILNKI